MGTPITWQNINAPSFADASRAMALAQQSITGAFDGLKTAVTDNEAFNKELWKRQDAEFTQRQLSAMYAAKTPEALAALQASGQMSNAVGPDGARADMGVINKAMDERTGVVQNQAMNSIKYTDAVRADKDAAPLAQARALSLAGDYTGAAQIGAQLSQQSQAILAADMDQRKRDLVERSQKDNKAAADLQHLIAQEDSWKAQNTYNQGMLGVSQKNANTQANEARLRSELQQAARLEKQLGVVEEKIGNTDALATSNTGYKKITDWLATVKDPKKNELLTTALGKARTSGALEGMSSSQTIAAMQADIDTSNWTRWGDNTGDGLAERLKQIRNNPASVESAKEENNRETQLKQMRADILGRLYPGMNFSSPAAESNRNVVNNPGAASSGSTSAGFGVPAAVANEPANSPWTPELRKQEQADRTRIAQSGGDFSPAVIKALEKEAAMVRGAQDETSAEKLKRVESEIRDKYKPPSGYETVYDRHNRTTNMQFELAQAKELVKSIDPQTVSDRDAAKRFLESLKDANGNAGAAIADVGLALPRAALTAYDQGVLRPLRAAGMNLPNTAPLLTPDGVSTTSLTPFTDVRRMRKALQDEVKKQK